MSLEYAIQRENWTGEYALIGRALGTAVMCAALNRGTSRLWVDVSQRVHRTILYDNFRTQAPTTTDMLDMLDTLVCWLVANQDFEIGQVRVVASRWKLLAIAHLQVDGTWEQNNEDYEAVYGE